MQNFLETNFEWSKCPSGYKLLAEEPTDPNPNLSLLPAASLPERIVPIGDERVTYRPLLENDQLYWHFAEVNTAEELLDFISKYGPLTEQGASRHPWGAVGCEIVSNVLEGARQLRRFVRFGAAERRQAASLGLGQMSVPVDGTLIIDRETGALRTLYRPKSLLSALWLQFAQKLAAGVMVRQCVKCHGLFEVGGGVGKRRVAKFCSLKCHDDFHNDARKLAARKTAKKRSARSTAKKRRA